jgi:hypothetical protein
MRADTLIDEVEREKIAPYRLQSVNAFNRVLIDGAASVACLSQLRKIPPISPFTSTPSDANDSLFTTSHSVKTVETGFALLACITLEVRLAGFPLDLLFRHAGSSSIARIPRCGEMRIDYHV